MKYCPSPTCAYAVKYQRPLEYRNEILACADCGAALSDQAPEFAAATSKTTEASVAGADRDVVHRLAVTLIAALLIAAGMTTPLFGFDASIMDFPGADADALRSFSLLSIGIGPFVMGFLIVELVALIFPALRERRVGGSVARAPLERAALALGGLLLLMQIAGMAHFMGSLEQGFVTIPPSGSIWAQLLLTHLALLALVLWVTRRGLLNGFALAVLVQAAISTLTFVGQLRDHLSDGFVAPQSVALLVLLLGAVVGGVVWLSRSSRPSGELGPTAIPFPISGLAPWTVATSLLALPAAVTAVFPPVGELVNLVNSSVGIYSGVSAFLTLDATLLFGFLFFRPREVGRLWARWVKGTDELGAVVRARALLPRALLLAGAILVFAPLARTLLDVSGAMTAAGFLLIEMIIGALVLLDLFEEWRARQKLGALVSIRPLHRMAEVEPVSYVLQRAGIPFFTRSVAYRAALQFFGPHVPVEILVPRDRADEARRILDGA